VVLWEDRPTEEHDITAILDDLGSVRYLIDAKGEKTDVLVPVTTWKALLASWKQLNEMIEDQEDRAALQDWLAKRAAGGASTISLDELEQELIGRGPRDEVSMHVGLTNQRKVGEMHSRLIESDPAVLMGKPVIAGTRITVELILEKLAAGETVEQIAAAHPRLTEEGIRAALSFAAEALRADVIYPLAEAAA
jgi:uncharacterized protein (DUF433 family)